MVGGARGFQREALQRALVHVAEHLVDRGHESLRVGSQLLLNRHELVGVPRRIRPAREHVEHVLLELAEVVHVDAAEGEQDLGRHPDRSQLDHGAQHREVGIVVGVAPELGRVGEETDLAQPVHELRVDPGPFGHLGERVLAAGRGEEPLEPRPVHVDDREDRREREPLAAQLPDAVEPLEVLLAVKAVAALLHRGLEQPFAGVVADGVDGEVGPLGQLVDPPAGFGHCACLPNGTGGC